MLVKRRGSPSMSEALSKLDAKAEMEELWTAVFGQPPAIDADPGLLAELILRCSEPPPVYETFAPLRLPPERADAPS